ncbi:hypothetical protein KHQ82_05880 [Mycoplasmatota bacterium]|nr:hypothetical protein KHQ82_05880 [Mycoplasmatota bacterium]
MQQVDFRTNHYIIGEENALKYSLSIGDEMNLQLMEYELFKQMNESEGTTIVQVTHSPKSTEYGSRIILVKDGNVSS